jgi:heat-inducible transcriptional repressor
VVNRLRPYLTARHTEEEDVADTACRTMAGYANEVCIILVSKRNLPVRVFIQGSSSLLEKPEFRNLEKIGMLLKTFEEKGMLAGWLQEKTQESGISVSIGRENAMKALQDCSVISAHFAAEGNAAGTVALIGPCRMRYSRALPLVSQMGRFLSRALENVRHKG